MNEKIQTGQFYKLDSSIYILAIVGWDKMSNKSLVALVCVHIDYRMNPGNRWSTPVPVKNNQDISDEEFKNITKFQPVGEFKKISAIVYEPKDGVEKLILMGKGKLK